MLTEKMLKKLNKNDLEKIKIDLINKNKIKKLKLIEKEIKNKNGK